MNLIRMSIIITESKCSTDLWCIYPNRSVNREVMFSPFYNWENETRKPYVLQKVQIEKSSLKAKRNSLGFHNAYINFANRNFDSYLEGRGILI